MEGFRDVMANCGLGELRYVGKWYTWERARSPKKRIRDRLDRFIISRGWLDLFPEAFIEHSVRYSSDHVAVVLKESANSGGDRVRGSRGFRFETGWLLDESCEERGLTSRENCDLCVALESELDGLHAKNDAYWYLRSRVAEVKDGDRNTAYFHHKASQRKKRNYIHGLKDRDGVWQTEEENIEREVDRYFDTIFTSSGPSRDNLQEVVKHVRPSVT
ncbi:uncharacterized protein LOC125496683 [Beta vulgaris subsp. vulgaris]|uniref:uncharacterized protein LOC125496683 n=1 Tax=Beta vulgaris subsp. vulgaris TaxID=3555 RepID=UPI002036F907|nr:uncharacterized protein LOC125496683 [Beta vulgaris subsp. vulgaris]